MPGRSITSIMPSVTIGLRQALDDVIPPGIGAAGVFEGDEVGGQGGADLDQRGQAEDAVAGAVRRHQDAVQIGVFGDPFQLGDARRRRPGRGRRC